MDSIHQAQFLRGIELFNREQFYECHDVIEEVWLEEVGEQRLFLQGMIQAAAAFHHYQNRKWGAARSMLRLALGKLEGAAQTERARVPEEFFAELRAWKDALDQAITRGTREPLSLPFPKVNVIRRDEKVW